MTKDPRNSPRYTPSEAARIVGVPASTVSRWLALGAAGPVIRGSEAHPCMASFLDLIELHMVAGLRRKVKPRVLKAAVRDAAERLGVDHPLARHAYLRDGGALFLEHEGAVLHLGKAGQLAFPNIIRARSEQVVFDGDGLALRWYPLGKHEAIVIDPAIQGGSPTIDGTRIDARTIAGMVEAEGDIEKVARIYGIHRDHVEAAWNWDQRLAA